MAKTFAMLVGWVLLIVGLFNFFVGPIKLLPVHAIVHIVAGLLGIWAAKSHAVGYAMWVGIVGILLFIIGLLTKNVLNLVDFPTWITVIHLVLGVWGFLTYFGANKGQAPAGASPSGTVSA